MKFRITKSNNSEMWYTHKKFLFWWVKFSTYKLSAPPIAVFKRNVFGGISEVYYCLNNGSFDFSTVQYGEWWQLKQSKNYTEFFCNSAEEFKQKYAEEFI